MPETYKFLVFCLIVDIKHKKHKFLLYFLNCEFRPATHANSLCIILIMDPETQEPYKFFMYF